MGASLRSHVQTDILAAMHLQPDYGPITPSEQYLAEMESLVHDPESLRRAGYVSHQLSLEDLERKTRCSKCNRSQSMATTTLCTLLAGCLYLTRKLNRAVTHSRQRRQRGPMQKQQEPQRPSDAAGQHDPTPHSATPELKPSRQQLRCHYHQGSVSQGIWTCCKRPPFGPPCINTEDHTPRQYAQGELARNWRFHPTPTSAAEPAAAVVIDCEMGTNIHGETELIRVSIVDYFQRTVLLDSLVWPDAKMAHYNTKFSGVSRSAMKAAKQNRTCIFGRADARKRLWHFIGPETIVIGHAAQGDLNSLRWIHPRIIDTLIIETRNRPPPPPPPQKEDGQDGDEEEKERAEGNNQDGDADGLTHEAAADDGAAQGLPKGPRERRKEGGLSLKALAQAHLNRAIQIKGRGHDSVEDALATRDILHWNVVRILSAREGGAS